MEEKAAANASRSGNHKVEISCSLLELRAQDSIDHCHLQVILECRACGTFLWYTSFVYNKNRVGWIYMCAFKFL